MKQDTSLFPHAETRATLTARQRAKTYDTRFVWSLMHARCSDPKNAGYKYFGARGVKVCRRWKNYNNFLKDMGERPAEKWIELKRNNRNFSPSNCYWAEREQQNKNRYLNTAFAHTAAINPDLFKILKRAIAAKRRRRKKNESVSGVPKRVRRSNARRHR